MAFLFKNQFLTYQSPIKGVSESIIHCDRNPLYGRLSQAHNTSSVIHREVDESKGIIKT